MPQKKHKPEEIGVTSFSGTLYWPALRQGPSRGLPGAARLMIQDQDAAP